MIIPDDYDVTKNLTVTKNLEIPWTTIIHDTLDDLAGDDFGDKLPELPKASPGRRLLINLYNNTFAKLSGKPRRKTRSKRKRRKRTGRGRK